MNLRQLRSLRSVLRYGSFAAAGDRIGLSHAAISMQMQQLEATLGVELFDRSRRPLSLTAAGNRIADIAGDVLVLLDNIKQVASGIEISTSISMGFIPTSVQYLLPRVLRSVRQAYPELQVKVKSGLSAELAAAVVQQELDYALLTTPVAAIAELDITPIASEPFHVIAPISQANIYDDAELLHSMPYIAFSRRTWVGQHIAAKLQQRAIHISESIEIDSLDAIENLVADGFGVSIVPRRLHAAIVNDQIIQRPFGEPVDTRQLALIRHSSRPKSILDAAITRIFVDLPGATTPKNGSNS